MTMLTIPTVPHQDSALISPGTSALDGTMTSTFQIARAEFTDEHLKIVLGLIDGAATWLRSKDTKQWSTPWPDKERRDARVAKGLEGGKTWIVWDRDIPAATVTVARHPNPAVWPDWACDPVERAVYVHRLITARHYAGWGLGAELIDWVGLRAAEQYGAEWIRIDVWTSNKALHEYYRERGFKFVDFSPDRDYPSGALFQKPISDIEANSTPLIRQPTADNELY
jgi:GNAT superfamily N-acetyltransferase